MHDVVSDFGLGDELRPEETPVTDEYEAFEDSGRIRVPPSGDPPQSGSTSVSVPSTRKRSDGGETSFSEDSSR